jgi:hypothetical protein
MFVGFAAVVRIYFPVDCGNICSGGQVSAEYVVGFDMDGKKAVEEITIPYSSTLYSGGCCAHAHPRHDRLW